MSAHGKASSQKKGTAKGSSKRGDRKKKGGSATKTQQRSKPAAVNEGSTARTGFDFNADCRELLELATPHLYRRNLFRVLGLPVNAGAKDVQRQQARRKMQEKLGIAATGGTGSAFALTPPPTEEDIRAAMERLNDPVARLLDEVFWFWPMNGDPATDAALRAIADGHLDEAIGLWTKQTGQGAQGQIATHNLAVCHHLMALDREAGLISEGGGKKEQRPLADLWRTALSKWKDVLEGEEFWSVVKHRVRELDDVQLTTGFVRRVRGTLPTALLLICGKMAYEAAERGDTALVGRQIRLIREAKFGDRLADEAIRESLTPVRERIKTAVENARGQWTSRPHQGDGYVRELHEQAKSLLVIVDAVLPADSVIRGGLHDMVAEAMLEGQIAFGRKTNDWTESLRLLALAQEVAVGERVRSRLSENVQILVENKKEGNDWYSLGYWDLPQEIISQLEAAHEKATAGDYEGAIEILIALDAHLGAPWQRCMAFALSQRGWQIAGQAITEFNSTPTRKLKKFLDVIGREGSVSVPDPNLPAFMLPPCPCCGSSAYTQWANGEYNGQRFWMCSSCSASDDAERERKKRKLRAGISEGLEYMMLAAEIDDRDHGVRNDLKSLRETARNVEAKIPNTRRLKKRLRIGRSRHHTSPAPEVQSQPQPQKAGGRTRSALPEILAVSVMLIAAAAALVGSSYMLRDLENSARWWQLVIWGSALVSFLSGVVVYWGARWLTGSKGGSHGRRHGTPGSTGAARVGAAMLGVGALVQGGLPVIEYLDLPIAGLWPVAYHGANILMAAGGLLLLVRTGVLRLCVAAGFVAPLVIPWLLEVQPWHIGVLLPADAAIAVVLLYVYRRWRAQSRPALSKYAAILLGINVIWYGGLHMQYLGIVPLPSLGD
ncbi:MAG: hypothetical protein GF393_02630, partial [Armatimonadia bacterium]|nr:hypothetical protein [Armatimonadia bacterium]